LKLKTSANIKQTAINETIINNQGSTQKKAIKLQKLVLTAEIQFIKSVKYQLS